MDKIYAWFFAILVAIIPWFQRYAPALDWEKEAKVVLAAIETRDINAIEALMCKNIKDNVPDLKKEIGKFIDAIEGKITKRTKRASNGSGFYVSSGGKTIEQKLSVWSIETTKDVYCLSIDWEIYNNFSFEERGIRSLGLTKKVNGNAKDVAGIDATEGIWSTHN